MGVALKLIDENLGQMCSGIVVLCPALLHPEFVPDEYKTIFKAYEENWTGSPLQDGESMMIFYGMFRAPLFGGCLLTKFDIVRPQRRHQPACQSIRLPMHSSWDLTSSPCIPGYLRGRSSSR